MTNGKAKEEDMMLHLLEGFTCLHIIIFMVDYVWSIMYTEIKGS